MVSRRIDSVGREKRHGPDKENETSSNFLEFSFKDFSFHSATFQIAVLSASGPEAACSIVTQAEPTTMDLADFHKYHFRITRVAAHLLGGPQSSAGASSSSGSAVVASPVAAAVQDLSKDAAWAREPWGDRHAELKYV